MDYSQNLLSTVWDFAIQIKIDKPSFQELYLKNTRSSSGMPPSLKIS